ncbi:MAG: hypothetical protein WC624_02345 [Candidatus Margulisiibacteriota bacterium]
MIILTPPIVFIILLAFSWLLAMASSIVAFKRKGPIGALDKPYAGGEDVKKHRVQPDYSQFFPFAFFFTILHVVTLVLATFPVGSLGAFVVAVVYIVGAMLGLYILFRR